MTIGKLLEKAALKKFKDIKACTEALGISYALFRKTVAEDHVPRDEQLLDYADKLDVDPALLIRLAHYQRAPKRAKLFLKDLRSDDVAHFVEKKIGISLSDEECGYLGKFLEVLRSNDEKVVTGLKVSTDAFFMFIQK